MTRLNRIYIRDYELAVSLYRRRKERCFTTEDVMRLHWNRQGAAALAWARLRIVRMREKGIVESFVPDDETDKRRRAYTFTDEQLEEWNLDS